MGRGIAALAAFVLLATALRADALEHSLLCRAETGLCTALGVDVDHVPKQLILGGSTRDWRVGGSGAWYVGDTIEIDWKAQAPGKTVSFVSYLGVTDPGGTHPNDAPVLKFDLRRRKLESEVPDPCAREGMPIHFSPREPSGRMRWQLKPCQAGRLYWLILVASEPGFEHYPVMSYLGIYVVPRGSQREAPSMVSIW